MTPQLTLFGDGALICDRCGTISPNQFVHDLNHTLMPSGYCVSQSLVLAHIESSRREDDGSRLARDIQRARDLRLTDFDMPMEVSL